MTIEELEKRKRDYQRRNDDLDKSIAQAKDELWSLRVRTIVASELARSAYEDAMRRAGIVKSFYGPYSPEKDED